MTLTSAVPALAAQVVDVRVGKHAAFTRVVFELDGSAGYKIERHSPVPGIAELVVSLEASSSSHKLKTPKQSLIEGVAVESDGRRTVAHITLARDGLRLKEMILAKPPRIVLDVMNDAPVAPIAKATPKPAPKPIAKATPPPEPAPAVEPVVAEKKPAITPAIAESEPTALAQLDAPSAAPVAPAPAERVAAVPPAPRAPERAGSPVPVTKPPAPAAKPATPRVPAARSVATTSGEPETSIFSARNAALAVAGIVLLVAGAWIVARRRGGAIDDEEFDDAYDDDNPFAGLGEGLGSEESASEQAFAPAPEPAGVDVSEDASAQTELFAAPAMPDDEDKPESAESAGASMDTVSSDFTPVIDSNPAPAMGDMPDVARLVRELESRVSQLESRLEEAVDARERLERQVAAQTEELRVQRAAIARTQRAVRNMSQPTDDLATEPAIRDPRPEGE